MRWVAALAAAAGVLAGGVAPWWAASRLPQSESRRPRSRWGWVAAISVMAALLLAATLGPVLAGAAIAGGLAALRWWRRRADRLRRRQNFRAVARACEVMETELRSGTPADVALARGLADTGSVARTLGSILGAGGSDEHLGAAPLPALDAAAGPVPGPVGAGDAAWGQVVACWRFAEQVGAPLADVLAALRADVADRVAQEDEAEVQAAGARTTGTLLALLPALGLGLGAALGAHPVAFLTGTPTGGVCLVLAVTLETAGLAWLDRLVRPRDSTVPTARFGR